jgi:TPP-dependent pyruvate/acetoin dehydrogenase alpha subunit
MGRAFPVASRRSGYVATSSVLTSGVLEPVPLPGGMVQVMAGVTVAAQMQGTQRVGLTLSSPGSPSTGAWHEGLNMAAVRRAPLVVVCHAPVGVGPSRETRLETLLDLCPGYGIRGWEAALDDPEGILQTSREAVAAARAEGGVQLLELRGEPLSTDERVAALLEGVRTRLLEHAEVEKEELQGWEASIPDEVEDAWDRAVAEQSGVQPEADATYQVEGVSGLSGRLPPLPDRPSSQVPFSVNPEGR